MLDLRESNMIMPSPGGGGYLIVTMTQRDSGQKDPFV